MTGRLGWLPMSVRDIALIVFGLLAIAAIWARLAGERADRTDAPASSDAPARRATTVAGNPLRLALVLILMVCVLAGMYWRRAETQHAIRFAPWQYQPQVFDSPPQLAAAMKAVYLASDDGTLQSAIAAVQRMADAGDAEAAFRLGRYYHLEVALPNYALALKYYRIAALKNHAWAINNIGLLYLDGLGVAQDEDTASQYFEHAATLKNERAYLNLAALAVRGPILRGDADRALAWLERGGHDECTLCYIQEAAIYHVGAYGVGVDRRRTVALLRKAAALGDHEAQLLLAEMYIVGDGVRQSSRSGYAMLKQLSDDGDAPASVLLGELSSDDKIRTYLFDSALGGVRNIPSDLTTAFPRDNQVSIQYWERANQQGSCQSWIDLSSVIGRGMGVNADDKKAFAYVERAVDCDPTNSFYLWKLAARYEDAAGVERNCQMARWLYEQSFNRGYPEALADLGYIYDKGCAPIARNDQQAFQYYLLGAKLGNAMCQNNVGAMIKHGRGVPVADVPRGYGWIKLAALHGNTLAQANLEDPLFTPTIRAEGLANLADIQRRLLAVPSDVEAILRDPWY